MTQQRWHELMNLANEDATFLRLNEQAIRVAEKLRATDAVLADLLQAQECLETQRLARLETLKIGLT